MQQSVARIGSNVRDLARERDFYYHKLETVERLCHMDEASSLSKRILKVLYRDEK